MEGRQGSFTVEYSNEQVLAHHRSVPNKQPCTWNSRAKIVRGGHSHREAVCNITYHTKHGSTKNGMWALTQDNMVLR